MNTLVTGGTGFIGRLLLEALQRRGENLTALVRSPEKGAAFAAEGARIVVGDLEDNEALDSATRGQDRIYHLAGAVKA